MDCLRFRSYSLFFCVQSLQWLYVRMIFTESPQKVGVNLVTSRQHFSCVASILKLPTYKSAGILSCFIIFHNNGYYIFVIFLWKITHMVPLQGSYHLVYCVCLALKAHVFISNSTYLVLAFFLLLQGLLILTPQLFFHLFGQLLRSIWKHQVSEVLSEIFCFCFWLSRQQQFIHSLLVDVHIVCIWESSYRSKRVYNTCTLLV